MLFVYRAITVYGQTFQTVLLSIGNLRASPRSLAATKGISVDFFSSGYLDVSVLRVRFLKLCIHLRMTRLYAPGFPIRTSADQGQFAGSPRLFACYNVLHRL
jgi:hypothetical protein